VPTDFETISFLAIQIIHSIHVFYDKSMSHNTVWSNITCQLTISLVQNKVKDAKCTESLTLHH
jgi:hypothetical protein